MPHSSILSKKMIENYKQSMFWSKQGVKIDNFSHQLSTIGSQFQTFFATYARFLNRLPLPEVGKPGIFLFSFIFLSQVLP